jgi:death-on-curing protein
MIEYLTVDDVLDLHEEVITETGGSTGLRDRPGLESAVANPSQTFAGADLYPSLIDKAGVLLWSLVQNHPFVDGNKRIGHAAAELFLRLNGKTIQAPVDEAENVVIRVASGECPRDELNRWLSAHVVERLASDSY